MNQANNSLVTVIGLLGGGVNCPAPPPSVMIYVRPWVVSGLRQGATKGGGVAGRRTLTLTLNKKQFLQIITNVYISYKYKIISDSMKNIVFIIPLGTLFSTRLWKFPTPPSCAAGIEIKFWQQGSSEPISVYE